ncbi:hypothetical protein D3C74_443550 [compost metagenome]
MTLAQVAFVKTRSDGLPLVGLHMNRTQCRSTSADFLVDPLLLQTGTPRRERVALSAFLVGAYCIEEELILRRRFEFPRAWPQETSWYFRILADIRCTSSRADPISCP